MFSMALRSRTTTRPFSNCRRYHVPALTESLPALFPNLRLLGNRKLEQTPFTGLTNLRKYSDSATTPEKVTPLPKGPVDYEGPLANTWRRLKLFSLASFGLSTTLAPFMFLVESGLPYPARLALVSIAVGTSGLSTSLVGWCAKPYVTTLRRYTPDGDHSGEIIEMTTRTLTLRPRITTVYDAEFLVETRRPMAKWELARSIILPESRLATEGQDLIGKQETVAETVDHNGQVIGRWVVEWKEGGEGICHEAGSVIRHFNVHEELLS